MMAIKNGVKRSGWKCSANPKTDNHIVYKGYTLCWDHLNKLRKIKALNFLKVRYTMWFRTSKKLNKYELWITNVWPCQDKITLTKKSRNSDLLHKISVENEFFIGFEVFWPIEYDTVNFFGQKGPVPKLESLEVTKIVRKMCFYFLFHFIGKWCLLDKI